MKVISQLICIGANQRRLNHIHGFIKSFNIYSFQLIREIGLKFAKISLPIRKSSADIIFPLISGGGDLPARRSLAAHALAQSRAFMVGRSPDEAKEIGASRGFNEGECRQLEIPGNHSHSLILMDAVTPECLGSLIAAYEHKTYFLAVLLGINAFDQWGVELGKEIAATIEPLLQTAAASVDSDALDPATRQAAIAWRKANVK